MRCTVRWLCVLGAWVVAVAIVGCGTFGGSAPSNHLLPSAKAIRSSAPNPAPIPRELAKELHPAFVVEPGDTLLVQAAELDAPVRLPPDQTIFPDGTIDLGTYGRPLVAGKTLAQIEVEVRKLVNDKEKAKEPIGVTIRLIGRASKVYYVLGEVNAPGAFPISGRETVLDGIIAAGGITKRAGEQSVVLSRPTPPDGCRVVYPVCYTNIVQLGDTTTNYQLQPGDRIYVPGRGTFEGLMKRKCKAEDGPCDRPQVGCWGAACATPAAGCATAPATTFTPAVLPAAPVAVPVPSVPVPIPAALPSVTP